MPDNNKNFISAVRGYLRLGSFPLDASTVFESYAEAEAYAEYSPTAYAGQIVSVIDTVGRTVAVYKLNFSDETESGKNYELGPLGGSNGQNGITMSDNVYHYNNEVDQQQTLEQILDFLLRILSGTPNGESYVIDRLQVDTDQISESNDVITKGWLENEINLNTIGVIKTIQVAADATGGISSEAMPKGSRIRRIYIDVYDSYGPNASLSIKLGYYNDNNELVVESDTLIGPDDIVQHPPTKMTIDLDYPTDIIHNHVVILKVVGEVSPGAHADILIDYLASPIVDSTTGGGVNFTIDGGPFNNNTFDETIDGGNFNDPQTDTEDGGNF